MTVDVTKDRHLGIGGSDATRIMKGDWRALYEEKLGIRQPEDLTWKLPVQLGKYTEPLHRQFFAQLSGLIMGKAPVARAVHPIHTFMFGHLDDLVLEPLTGERIPLEMKHTNERNDLRSLALDYMPQLAHYCAIYGASRIYLSAIFGNTGPEWSLVDVPQAYIDQVIEAEIGFWWHVENQVPPTDRDSAAQRAAEATIAFAPEVLLDGMKPFDMTKEACANEWGAYAASYIDNQQAAKDFEAAKDALKKLVPANASECSGNGVLIKRQKNGLRFYDPK